MLKGTANEIKTAPNNAVNWASHASALLANSYYEESIIASKHALEIKPDGQFPLRYRQAQALWWLNQQEVAISELRSVLKEVPQSDFAWRTLASWYLDRGELDLAFEAINHAWNIAPNRPGTLATFVQILMQQDRVGQAISKLSPRLNKVNTPPYLYFLASQAYRRLGETESMKIAVGKGKPLPKQWPDPWRNEIAPFATGKRVLAKKAVSAFRMQGGAATLSLLATAFDADSSNSQVRGLYAIALLETNQIDQALRILEGINDSNSAVYEYWIAYANCAAMKSTKSDRDSWLQKSLDCYKRAEEISGGSPKMYRSMAQLAGQLANQEESVLYFKLGAQMLIDDGKIDAARIVLSEGVKTNVGVESLQQLLDSLADTPK
jgi:tetratricopeptide (TPR) repeat protein